jgi:membrane-bound lytic murein transglycosylase D
MSKRKRLAALFKWRRGLFSPRIALIKAVQGVRTACAASSGVLTAIVAALVVITLAAGTYFLLAQAGSLLSAVRLKKSLASAVARADLQISTPASGPDDHLDKNGGLPAVCLLDPQKDKNAESLARSKIKEAAILYRRAGKSYQHGNSVLARELYERSLATLAEAHITADAYYRLKEQFSLLFYNLDRSWSSLEQNGRENVTHRPIPLDGENELVRKYLKIYTAGKPREKVLEALERSGRYRAMIESVLKEYNLPAELVYLPILESLYDENDLSAAGALGLWQLMPARARDLGLRVNFWIDERKDPEKSTRAAARYLKQLFIIFDDWHLALAAYNRGENGLARDLALTNATNIAEMCERNAVPLETQNYVPQFIVCTLIGENPGKYGFLPAYEKPPAIDEVRVNAALDLTIVARCAGTTMETIRELNPALKVWCTPPNYSGFILHLPAGAKKAFAAAITGEKDLNPSQRYVKYRVAKGDSLSSIADTFCTTSAAIREDNHILQYRRCKANQTLVIRPGKQYYVLAGR